MKKIIEKIFGKCMYCGIWFLYPKRFHQGTNYMNSEDNYTCACEKCKLEIIENWQDLKNSLI